MLNVNPDTGIRYGVISCNSLNPDLVDELMHGPDAVDLDYQFAYKEAKAQAEADLDAAVEEAEIAASEVDPNACEAEREAFIENWLEVKGIERDTYVDDQLERFSDMYQGDEPVVEGNTEGVAYRISWLGGAPLLWVLEGPLGYCNRLCSPCVPNAADLDSGFIPGGADDTATTLQEGYLCYVIPADWLAKEIA
ncbi:MAG: hypothetical protein ACSLE8_06360 [Rhodococcus sp. (in: high G+C Gram-positive bacteria)]